MLLLANAKSCRVESRWLLGSLDAGQGPREGGAPPSSLRALKGLLVVNSDRTRGGSLHHSFCLLCELLYNGECFGGSPKSQRRVWILCFGHMHCDFPPYKVFSITIHTQEIFDKAYLTLCKCKQAPMSHRSHTLVYCFISFRVQSTLSNTRILCSKKNQKPYPCRISTDRQ